VNPRRAIGLDLNLLVSPLDRGVYTEHDQPARQSPELPMYSLRCGRVLLSNSVPSPVSSYQFQSPAFSRQSAFPSLQPPPAAITATLARPGDAIGESRSDQPSFSTPHAGGGNSQRYAVRLFGSGKLATPCPVPPFPALAGPAFASLDPECDVKHEARASFSTDPSL
jgi:hypothetical protein